MSERHVDIIICMGSSCFSRGNNRNIELIESALAAGAEKTTCQIEGHLCQNLCKVGPNIVINGKIYHEVDPVTLMTLLHPANTDTRTHGGQPS